MGVPIYELLGGETKPRVPVYCTGNDIEQHVAHGFKRLFGQMVSAPASKSGCSFGPQVSACFMRSAN